MIKNNKIYIGTSGWTYYHWRDKFYPSNLPHKNFLNYYSQYFNTVEVNSSFYHLPLKSTIINWQQKVSKSFIFSVKVWRRITHIKKLNNIQNDLKIFIERFKALNKNLGVFLFQFPPSFKINLEKLKNLADQLYKLTNVPIAVEFRHPSWFKNDVYYFLKKYNFILCWSDTPHYPYKEIITGNYIYIRLHGHQKIYSSSYSEGELWEYAQKIKNRLKKIKKIFVYFDNDAFGYAIDNALKLKEILKI